MIALNRELTDEQRDLIILHLPVVERVLRSKFVKRGLKNRWFTLEEYRSAAQESLVRSALKCPDRSRFESYCYTAMINGIRQYARQEYRRGVTVGRGRTGARQSPKGWHRVNGKYQFTFQTFFISGDVPEIPKINHHLKEYVDKLPRKYRALVWERYWLGMSLKELADKRSVSINLISVRLKEAQEQLKLSMLRAEQR